LGKYLLFLILNADYRNQRVQLPPPPGELKWRRAIDTSLPACEDFIEPDREVVIDPPDHYWVNSRSVVVLIAR
jgi:hypothetical protein